MEAPYVSKTPVSEEVKDKLFAKIDFSSKLDIRKQAIEARLISRSNETKSMMSKAVGCM